MISSLRNFAKTKIAGIFVFIIIIPFVFWGMGSIFNDGNTNNIVKINNQNISTQDFMNYLNESGIAQQTIRENLDDNIIEELLSGLISTTLINLEIKDFNILFTDLTLLKKIKKNKNFLDKNNIFQRTKYEKFLLTNNISAPIFEQRLKNRELQKHLFDFIGAGTVSPEFLIKKIYKEESKVLELEYFDLHSFYKSKTKFTDFEIKKFLEENKNQLEREYIDFEYAIINPKNLIGLDEFNKEFFDELDKIENKISNGDTFESIIKKIGITSINVKKYTPTSNEKFNEDKVYSNRSFKIDLIENENDFILFDIKDSYNLAPDISDVSTKNEIVELLYQKNKFDINKEILDKIQNKEFNNNEFFEMGNESIKEVTITSIEDNNKFTSNSVKILYALPIKSFTIVNDKYNKIYLVKIINSQIKSFEKDSTDYLKFINKQNTNNKASILKSYDIFLNNKYKVELNHKTIDRVKNYFR